MRTHAALQALLLAFLVANGVADARPRREVEAPPPPTAPEPPPAPPAPPPLDGLFPATLPLDPGAIPVGLANLSAQGCNACHFEAHDGWATSRHATGHVDPAFLREAARMGPEACSTCHEPLTAQHAGPGLDATLSTEGVTCAACHVRDGKVVASHPVDGAPHPMTWSPDLATSKACAPCHQLTWPGADRPWYDTYGEWERSPQASAGISCQGCHMGPGADATRSGSDHGFGADPARAVSLLVRVDRVDLTRGGPPLSVDLTLENTGAGHSFPTGSPWTGVRLEASLVGPVGKNGARGGYGTPFRVDLARAVDPDPPYATRSDTRLPAGGQQSWQWPARLDAKAPGGDWSLRVILVRTVAGEPSGEPFVEQVVPLRVD